MRNPYLRPSGLATRYTLVRFLSYLIAIASTNQINQNTAKASLTQMINIVFSKMEAYSGNFGISLSKLQAKNSLAPGSSGRLTSSGRPNSIEDGDLSHKSLSIKGGSVAGSQVAVTEPQMEEEKDMIHHLGSVSMTEASSPL
jgi:hypothetical protein